MLSKPYAGWTSVNIGNFSGVASYLTDVPMDCLISFINALKYDMPASIYFNEEGYGFILVADFNNVYIILERENTELIKVDKTLLDLTKELIDDIEINLEGWVNWQYFYESSEEEINQIRLLIKSKLEELKYLLFNIENNFKLQK